MTYHADKGFRVLEAVFATLAITLTWSLYSPIGTLNSLRKVNFAKYILTPLDYKIPFWTFPIYAYSIAFLVIPIVAITCVWFRWQEKAHVRMVIASFFPMTLLAFLIFTLFPVSIITVKSIPDLNGMVGIDIELLRGTYAITNPWNAFPSIHIATGTLGFRLLQATFRSKTVLIFYGIWFLVMAIGTLTLQYHSIADVLAGLLLAEFTFRLAKNYQSEISEFYDAIPRITRISIWLLFLGTLVTIHGYASAYDLYKGTI